MMKRILNMEMKRILTHKIMIKITINNFNNNSSFMRKIRQIERINITQ